MRIKRLTKWRERCFGGICVRETELGLLGFASKVAATRANELSKPWVLDPVGVGATRFRTEKCIELIKLNPTVIRGNATEIMAVVGASTAPTKVRFSIIVN